LICAWRGKADLFVPFDPNNFGPTLFSKQRALSN
jgi:hypothetical protein